LCTQNSTRAMRPFVMSLRTSHSPIPSEQRWSYFLTQPAKVDSPMQRMIHDENAETVFG
jgi:hypothetical protein